MNPLARDPEALAEFRRRVDAGDWARARRLALVLGLHNIEPQVLLRDEVWLRNLARRYGRPPSAVVIAGRLRPVPPRSHGAGRG